MSRRRPVVSFRVGSGGATVQRHVDGESQQLPPARTGSTAGVAVMAPTPGAQLPGSQLHSGSSVVTCLSGSGGVVGVRDVHSSSLAAALRLRECGVGVGSTLGSAARPPSHAMCAIRGLRSGRGTGEQRVNAGSFVAGTSDRSVWVRRLALAHRVLAHDGCVNTVNWDLDGNHFVSGSDDTLVSRRGVEPALSCATAATGGNSVCTTAVRL